jgi:two-component system, chemotaxis family, CheB/CheR fusion protein
MNESNNSHDFLIAALGASAGGLEPLESFFKKMPSDAGIAFVIVQHLAPDHPSALPELLARHTEMPVEQARDDTKIIPNRVYVIPPNATLTIKDSVLHVSTPIESRGHRTPIDNLFSSLAQDRGENAVCIMFSGTGTDGTIGLSAIKEFGGMAMAQTLESAKYDAILRSALATGLVDHVLAVEEMPAKLLEYAAHLSSMNGDGKSNGLREQITTHLSKIHDVLHRSSGHDFSQYKESTIARRLERRMKARQIENVEQYIQLLDREPEEADRLFKDLLIGVTQFFRDTAAFEALEREVIPKLFEGKEAGSEVRVCVVGCASGEEAYSIAILLYEHASKLAKRPKLQIFATDIDERAIEAARKGLYPESSASHVSPERLERFFIKQDGAYQIKRELREICLFSLHSFIKDPPFSRLDMVSCRNVMIYLGPDLQRKIIPLFHYALRPGGYLFLGTSESASSHRELFRTVDKKNRFFQKKETLPRPAVEFPVGDVSRPAGAKRHQPEDQNFQKQLERIILQRYRPACVTVKENGDAVYFSGQTSRYLEQPTGAPDLNVINLAREGLRNPLRTALHRAVTAGERVVQKQIPIQADGGGTGRVDFSVEPLAEFRTANLYMIVFEDPAPSPSPLSSTASPDPTSEDTIGHLEDELRSAREHAQTMFEELETSNEELKSANEEYQSTNEELETSKEELQSFNEELQTVNAEVSRKNAELDQSNNDLQNLLNSTRIATVFLDSELRIRTFTPAAGSVFRLIPGDVGRPLTDLAAQFSDADLMSDIRDVLRTQAERERQLAGIGGKHYQLRILPYRTAGNIIDGVVLTFADVTLAKQAARIIEEAKIYAESIVETVRDPLLVLDAGFRVKSANSAFYAMFQVSPNEALDTVLYDLGDKQWDIPELRRLLSELLPGQQSLKDFEVEQDFPKIGSRKMLLNARQVKQPDGHASLILLAIEDVTERKRIEDATVMLAAVVEFSDDAIISKDLNGVIRSWNEGARRLFGYSMTETIGRPVSMLIPADREDEEPRILDSIRRGQTIDHYETVRRRKDGTLIDVSLTVSPIKNTQGQIIGASKIARDITEGKRARALVDCQRQAFESLASGSSLLEVLDAFARAVARHSHPGAVIAFHLLDDQGSRFERTIAPDLPPEYASATDGMDVGSLTGPCCAAVLARQRVVVADVATSREFPAFATFCAAAGNSVRLVHTHSRFIREGGRNGRGILSRAARAEAGRRFLWGNRDAHSSHRY